MRQGLILRGRVLIYQIHIMWLTAKARWAWRWVLETVDPTRRTTFMVVLLRVRKKRVIRELSSERRYQSSEWVLVEVSRRDHSVEVLQREAVKGHRSIQQVTTSIQMSTHQRNNSRMEENSIQAGSSGPPALETVVPVCNFAFAKAAIVSAQDLHCSV